MLKILIGVVLGLLICAIAWIIHLEKEEKQLRKIFKRK